MRVKMVVAYDGTNYSGWQIQPNGVTIEQKLNEALQALLGEDIRVTGASRTDAGVHSLGNVCIFDTDTRHPRFSRSRKTYEYRILNRRFRMPTRRLDTYFYHYPLDVEKMQEAADYLVGEHDFKSFCAVNAQSKTSVRTIYACTVTKEADIITIRVTGNGFLYNMVRIIAGTLIKVGAGEFAPQEMQTILDACDRSVAGPTAPAHGLTMIGLEYE